LQPPHYAVVATTTYDATAIRQPCEFRATVVFNVKVKVRTFATAPLRESSPQKRSGMARVLKGSHSFTCTPTRSIRNGNEPYLHLPFQL